MGIRFGVLLVLAVTQLAGCGLLEGEPECEKKGTGVTGIAGVFSFGRGMPAYAVAGKPTVYPFTYPIQQTCEDTVTPRLERADGTEVPAQWSVQRVEGDNSDATLELTTMETGVFQLSLTFEPGARVATLDIIVVEDRSTALTEIPHWCTNVYRTVSGTFLCDGRVFREGIQVATLPVAKQHAVAGNAVWEWSASEAKLRRYVDEGRGALRAEPIFPLGVGCCSDADQLVATETELLAVGTQLRRYGYTLEGLVARGSADYGQAQGNVKSFFGEKLLIRKESLAFLVFQQEPRSEACVFSLAGNEVKPVPWNGPISQQHNGCQLLAGKHVGVGDGGVWVYDVSKLPYLLRFYAPVGEGLVEAASIQLHKELEVGPARGVNPGPPELRHGGERILPRFVDGRVQFERYVPEPGYEFRDSHEGLVTFITSAGPGSTRVYLR